MKDLAIALENRPGALADVGDALGRAGVSIEGGGVFVVNGCGIGHFLSQDGATARAALAAAGICVLEERDVVMVRLRQAEPGQPRRDRAKNRETRESTSRYSTAITIINSSCSSMI